MNRFNENVSEDELNGKWQTLLEQSFAEGNTNSCINKIVLNADSAQEMKIVSGPVAANGNDSASIRKDVVYSRTRVDKKDAWGLWEKR
jgi:hypothetical protein